MSKITRMGYEELIKRKEKLIKDTKEYQIEFKRAREQGDLRENADYHATKDKLQSIEKELRELDESISSATIVDVVKTGGLIEFGSKFTVQMKCSMNPMFNGDKTFVIVGEKEANFLNGLIDEKGTLGQALIGKKSGDDVFINDKTVQIIIKEILN